MLIPLKSLRLRKPNKETVRKTIEVKIESTLVDVYVVDVLTSEARLLWPKLTSREFRLRFKLWDSVKNQAFLLPYPSGIMPKLTNLI